MTQPAAPASTPAPAPTAAPASTPAAAPAATPAATPPPSPIGTDGSLGENWHLSLGDEFAAHTETLSRFKSVGDMAKSYLHARQMKPHFPTAESTPQQVAEWREVAGVPENADGYALTKPEDYPEGLDWNEARLKGVAELAHKHHVHPSFIQELVALDTQFQTQNMADAQAQVAANQEAAKNALIQEWGGNYEQNASLVRHLTGRLAETAGLEQQDAERLANDPSFAKVMLRVNSIISEDSTRTPAGIGDTRGPQQRADDIMKGKDSEWSEAYKRGDSKAMELVSRLLQEAQQ